MNKDTKQLLKEIDKIIDSYIPHKELISIPLNKSLFHHLKIKGIYILYSGKAIIYIGCSMNIGDRLKAHFNHRIYGKKITNIDVIRIFPHENSIEIEAKFIEEFKPYYNKANQYLSYNKMPLDFVALIKQMKERWH